MFTYFFVNITITLEDKNGRLPSFDFDVSVALISDKYGRTWVSPFGLNIPRFSSLCLNSNESNENETLSISDT